MHLGKGSFARQSTIPCFPSLLNLPLKLIWAYCACMLLPLQARYVVERMDPELWGKVLEPENKFRRQVIDQVSAAQSSAGRAAQAKQGDAL